MIQIFSMLRRAFRRGRRTSSPTEGERLAWMRDPLAHPAIVRMDARELGDLPFSRGRRMACD